MLKLYVVPIPSVGLTNHHVAVRRLGRSVLRDSQSSLAVVVYAFNPRQRQADPSEFKASLVHRASSKTGSKATQKPSRLEA